MDITEIPRYLGYLGRYYAHHILTLVIFHLSHLSLINPTDTISITYPNSFSMSSEQTLLINFITRLPPGKNPYREVAHFLTNVIQPNVMPSWFHKLERGIAFAYLLVFLQAVYVIYIRVKTKKFYFFRFNTLGLLQLDRANHMAMCEGLFSAASIAEQVFRDQGVAGHLHVGWSSFLIGAKFMFAFLCIIVFQWLCICNCALLEWKPMGAHPTREEYFMPPFIAWVLHTWLALTIVWTTVPLIWTACALFIECHRVNVITKHAVKVLLRAASTYSPQKYEPAALFVKLLPLQAAIPHAKLIKHYAHVVDTFCMVTSAIILVIYTPFLVMTIRSFHKRHELDDKLRKQQWQVLTHALIQYKSFFISIPIMAYMISLPLDTAIYNPNYWISIRIVRTFLPFSRQMWRSFKKSQSIQVLGLESSISGVVSLFLICCTTPKRLFNPEQPNTEHQITQMKAGIHEEVDEKIIERKSEAVLVSAYA